MKSIPISGNKGLNDARSSKADEFYTPWDIIDEEISVYVDNNQDVFRNKTILCPCDDPERSNFTKYFLTNFDRFGLKKLISTSYVKSSRNRSDLSNDDSSPHGKIFVFDRNSDQVKDCNDIRIEYLKGDGDFRNDEITALLNESDIVVTNPPFSLFLEFVNWIMNANKEFIIIGNICSVSCKDVFPLLKNNEMWFGATIHSGDRKFYVPDDYPLNAAGCGIDEEGKRYIRVKGVRWFTNIDYNIRHDPLSLVSKEENLKYNKKLKDKLKNKYNTNDYPRFDNYNAIEIPVTSAIPSDYDGVMGVPISFLDKYNPEQFEILGISACCTDLDELKLPWTKSYHCPFIHGKPIYQRIFIRKTFEHMTD